MSDVSQHRSLICGFLKAVHEFPFRPAIVVERKTLTYEEVGDQVANLAETIAMIEPGPRPLIGILAHRSSTAYVGVLAAMASGRGYVPLNLKHPLDRIRRTLALSGTDLLIVGREAEARLEPLLLAAEGPLIVITPDTPANGEMPARYPQHRFVSADDICSGARLPPDPHVSDDSIAYLLFTSGSTGDPKGVPVTHASARSYVEHTCRRLGVDEHDRFSQMHDLSFDFSVHDLFSCWERGACLYCVPEQAVFAPAKFIRDNQLTVWASVPSVVAVMLKMRMLQPGSFPSLRYSVFCGEPLPASSAEAWQRAAPNSTVENIYGPTEATVAITSYRWDSAKAPDECVHGIVPIGRPFPGQRCRIIDEAENEVPNGSIGELCLAGSQVAAGYWNDPQQTMERFTTLPGTGRIRWYRTGDLVRRDERGCFHFVGRVDNQIKIKGYRVELQEIDFAMRQASGSDQVASVGWPIKNGSAEGVVGFVGGARQPSEDIILKECRRVLPGYMVPKEIIFLDALPLNENGKIDRNRLADGLSRKEK